MSKSFVEIPYPQPAHRQDRKPRGSTGPPSDSDDNAIENRIVKPAYFAADDDPITLAEACEMFFRGAITVASLKAEERRGNLGTFKIGRTIFTTPHDIREMQKKCRVIRKVPAFTSTGNVDNGPSGTEVPSAALAALKQTVKALKSGLPNTSRPNIAPRRVRRP